ncbi:hypothetical protein INT48_008866 [Thamnidium elegans]|uniref:Uncharacterized protein n=1 Tax=Thamnidium elegans TaxID=101142 RepID=A0A8H7SS17_9FUNG|nr:hypothetical protein INT48_008866 [Thamnidium elegans]
MSLLALFCVAYHSSATKVTTIPTCTLAARYYTTTTSNELNLKPSILDSIIPFRQQEKIINPINQLHETNKLIKNIHIFAPYLSHHLYDIENNETYNKYKWNPLEKNAMANALNWINKKPTSITTQDLIILSFLVKTRSPVQCRRFLQYRIKNKMTGFV